MSDRVLVMYLGRVAEVGPTEAIFDRPAPPLYDGAAGLDAVDGPRPPHAEGADGRRSAQPDRPAVRLPLPHPLHLRRRRVRATPSRRSSMSAAAIWPPATCRSGVRPSAACRRGRNRMDARCAPDRRCQGPHRRLPAGRETRPRGRGRRSDARRRRDAGAARRIRLRQERDPAGADAAASESGAASAAASTVDGSDVLAMSPGELARLSRQRRLDDLPGARPRPRSGLSRRRADRRGRHAATRA